MSGSLSVVLGPILAFPGPLLVSFSAAPRPKLVASRRSCPSSRKHSTCPCRCMACEVQASSRSRYRLARTWQACAHAIGCDAPPLPLFVFSFRASRFLLGTAVALAPAGMPIRLQELNPKLLELRVVMGWVDCYAPM